MRVLLIASGGGHTGFIRAVLQYLGERSDVVIPKDDVWSREMVREYAENIYEIRKPRMPGESLLYLVSGLPSAFAESFRLDRYDVTVASGSNHSIAPALVSRVKGSKLYLIESQDRFVTKGKTVSLLSPFSKRVFLHWKEQSSLYPRKGTVVGPIVEKPKYNPEDRGYVLVTTGSMGFPELVKKVVEIDRDLVVQAGPCEEMKKLRSDWVYFTFDPDLERWISGASVVVTHQGKTAMEAAIMYRKPVIIVYNKRWTSAAGVEDTRRYAKVLGAKFLDDPSTWRRNELIDALEDLSPPVQINSGAPDLVKFIKTDYEGADH